MNSLNAKRTTQANFAEECPDEFQRAGEPQPHLAAKVGIAANELDTQQQSERMAILKAFTSRRPGAEIKQRMDLLKTAGTDQI